ncbi:MAG: hypothetical protein QOJ15_10897 [Bradyrhizobium sp.]|jgi:hypothetical protein|nr:hypothetical protein [Bradyrhizobium sp.]
MLLLVAAPDRRQQSLRGPARGDPMGKNAPAVAGLLRTGSASKRNRASVEVERFFHLNDPDNHELRSQYHTSHISGADALQPAAPSVRSGSLLYYFRHRSEHGRR